MRRNKIYLFNAGIFRFGKNSQRGLCSFTCINIKEHYGQTLKSLPVNGNTNNAVIQE